MSDKAGRQSPPPEEQNPKQGKQAIASGKVERDKSEFHKASAGEEKRRSKNALDKLPSNPDRKARV